MSWKADVIVDDSGKWCSNSLRFATERAAEHFALELTARWAAVRDWRVLESTDPVNAVTGTRRA